MAATLISVQELTERNKFADAKVFTGITAAIDASDGAKFAWGARDDKYIVLVQNVHASAAKKVTVKAGNGIQGVNDISVSIPAGDYTIVALDSGRFKNVTGENKGYVMFTGDSADIKIAVFKLP